jgi:hypothetical protein
MLAQNGVVEILFLQDKVKNYAPHQVESDIHPDDFQIQQNCQKSYPPIQRRPFRMHVYSRILNGHVRSIAR